MNKLTNISLASRPNLLRNTHFVALKGLFKRIHFYIKKKITRSKQGKTFLQRLISAKVWICSKYFHTSNQYGELHSERLYIQLSSLTSY